LMHCQRHKKQKRQNPLAGPVRVTFEQGFAKLGEARRRATMAKSGVEKLLV
jgi:hypothetical protein